MKEESKTNLFDELEYVLKRALEHLLIDCMVP